MASIKRDGKRWKVVYDEPRGPDGKRRQHMRRGFTSRKAAAEWLAETQTAIKRGAYVAPKRQILDTYAQGWLAAVRVRLAPTTLALYETVYAAYVRERLGGLQLQQLDRVTLSRFYADLAERGGRRGRPLGAKSVRNVHVLLHRMLADAVRDNLLARNPADDAELPKTGRRPASVWSPEQTGAFLAALRADRLYPAFLTFATCGMRRSEVLGLRWSALDLDAGRLSVVSTLVLVRGVPVLRDETKSRAGVRVVPLDVATVAALRAHRKAQAAERLAWGPAYQDHGLVFCQENGEPLHPGRFSKRFTRLVGDAGLPAVRLHDLRHDWATAALRSGVAPKVVQERLGHANISITLDTYSHVLPGMGEQAAETVASAILGADVINR